MTSIGQQPDGKIPAEFDDIDWTPSSISDLNGRLRGNVLKLASTGHSTSSTSLVEYCRWLKDTLEYDVPTTAEKAAWLVPDVLGKLKTNFVDSEYAASKKSAYIKKLLDNLLSEFPLLGYFRTYLSDSFGAKFGSVDSAHCGNPVLDEIFTGQTFSSARNYIKDKVGFLLALAVPSGESYQDFVDKYIHGNLKTMDITDV